MANTDVQTITNILHDEHERLLAFSIGLSQATADDDPDGEFARGEEPGADERSANIETLGIQAGSGVVAACLYSLCARNNSKVLSTFLERTRTPF